MRLTPLIPGLLLAYLATSAIAEPVNLQLPVTIEAASAELDERTGTSTYTGNVVLTHGNLRLSGDRLQIRHNTGTGAVYASLQGSPASARRDTNPVLEARARSMTFSSSNRILELVGDASVTRGAEKLAGERIRYDLTADNILADSEEGERVRIILQPPENGRSK